MHNSQAAASQEADIPVLPLLMKCSELRSHANACSSEAFLSRMALEAVITISSDCMNERCKGQKLMSKKK
jgi:hypothetical protein